MKNLVLVSAQGCDKVFGGLFDRVEFISPKTKFTADTTVLFEGGTDVDPGLYGQKRHPFTSSPDELRDSWERQIFNQVQEAGGSCIGICRGAQFLTVMSGGSLFQHVTGHGVSHSIDTEHGVNLLVTSTHHQMCNPYVKGMTEDEDFVVIGWSLIPQSKFYAGEVGPLPPPIKEPEIVWYPKTRALAIQGHPEYVDDKVPFRRFSAFLAGNLILNQRLTFKE